MDTDVVTILVGTYHDLALTQPFGDIWVAFGIGKHCRFYNINAICASLGEPRSRVLPVFHAFSGCCTTSAFKGRGKKSVWKTWHAYGEITETFEYLACHPFELVYVDSAHFKAIERLTVIFYDEQSTELCQPDKKRHLLPEESVHRKNATNTGCSTAAYPTGSVPSSNLDHQLTDPTSGFFSPGICLGQGI